MMLLRARPAPPAATPPAHRPLKRSAPPSGWASSQPGPSPSLRRSGSTPHPPAPLPAEHARTAAESAPASPPSPVGLFGFAIAMIFVCGVMAASSRSNGNAKSAAACTVTARRIRAGSVDLVHRVRRNRQQQLIPRIQKRLAKHVDRLVHAIRQHHLLRRSPR